MAFSSIEFFENRIRHISHLGFSSWGYPSCDNSYWIIPWRSLHCSQIGYLLRPWNHRWSFQRIQPWISYLACLILVLELLERTSWWPRGLRVVHFPCSQSIGCFYRLFRSSMDRQACLPSTNRKLWRNSHHFWNCWLGSSFCKDHTFSHLFRALYIWLISFYLYGSCQDWPEMGVE